MDIWKIDWHTLFIPSVSPLELFVRGTIIYLTLFVLLRLVVKRQAGAVGITDLLVVVLLADAVQNGMAGDYRSVTDAILLVATIIFWSYFLDWLGHRFPQVQRFIHPGPLLMVKNGRMHRKNMEKELITEDEINSALRQQGVDSMEHVKEMYMEGDGRFSIITRGKGEQEAHGNHEDKRL